MTILGPTATTVVEVTGADRADYLEAVTTQRVLDLRVGEVRGAMYLDPHGAPLAVFDVVALPDRLLLLVPDPGLADRVVEILGGRTFLSDARFVRRDDTVLALRGDDATELLDRAGLAPGDGAAAERDGVVVVSRPGIAQLVGSGTALDAAVERLEAAGAERVDARVVADLAVAAGEPRWGREIAPPHLPEELGLLPTHVHLAKGCYPGQEAVARMWMLGRPRRRLARVSVDPGVTPGWSTGSGKRSVEVTAVAEDGDQGLAFVPADAAPGDRLEDERGQGVRVETFVGDGVPVPGHDPAVTRRRDRR